MTVDSIYSEFSGTAIEGEDYSLGENDTLFFFPEDVDTLNFTITTIYDQVPNEDEYLTITIFYFNGCGELDSASTSIPIVDPYVLRLKLQMWSLPARPIRHLFKPKRLME